ncbi:MAG: hypothetical protein GX804_07295 [Lentisphaerae bacterium]|jgi:hypothetical protein|nr:hypothetical protein [Lentisphaerota bacterium]
MVESHHESGIYSDYRSSARRGVASGAMLMLENDVPVDIRKLDTVLWFTPEILNDY